MRIQYWGTAAAEGIPGIFCNCGNCRLARLTKGKNIRSRSQILINDDLLIDFGPDTYSNSLRYDFDMSRLSNILVTHPHKDHFYPDELTNRLEKYARSPVAEMLIIHGAKETLDAICAVSDRDIRYKGQSRMAFDTLRPFEPRRIGDYTVTPLPARHTTASPFLYLIEDGVSSFLVMNDTARPDIEVYEYLEKRGVRLGAVSFDTTYGLANALAERGTEAHHMGLVDNYAVRELLVMKGIADRDTVCIASHFSHQGVDIDYDTMCEHARVFKFTVSYDGMTVEI